MYGLINDANYFFVCGLLLFANDLHLRCLSSFTEPRTCACCILYQWSFASIRFAWDKAIFIVCCLIHFHLIILFIWPESTRRLTISRVTNVTDIWRVKLRVQFTINHSINFLQTLLVCRSVSGDRPNRPELLSSVLDSKCGLFPLVTFSWRDRSIIVKYCVVIDTKTYVFYESEDCDLLSNRQHFIFLRNYRKFSFKQNIILFKVFVTPTFRYG